MTIPTFKFEEAGNGYFVEIGMDVQEHIDGWYKIQEKQK